jgi:hypothetical protein
VKPRNTASVNRPPGFIARRTFAKAATGFAKKHDSKARERQLEPIGREWMDGSVGDDDLRVPQSGSSDPFARPGDRWLGDICAKDMTARADTLRQLENCRAGAATNIEHAPARLGRRHFEQLPRKGGDRTIHSCGHRPPAPRTGRRHVLLPPTPIHSPAARRVLRSRRSRRGWGRRRTQYRLVACQPSSYAFTMNRATNPNVT